MDVSGRTRGRPSDRLRAGAVALAGTAGAGLGLLLGAVWQLLAAGETRLALAIATATIVLTVSIAFQLAQARVLAALLDRTRVASASEGQQELERRLLAVEEQLSGSGVDA